MSKLKSLILDFTHKIAREFKLFKIDCKNKQMGFKVMSSLKTIEYIQKNKCSVARFGDGEFRVILTDQDIGFQKNTKELSLKLREVFCKETNGNLLLCVAYPYYNHKRVAKTCKDVWKFIKIDHMDGIQGLLYEKEKRIFGDAQLSRPWMDYQNKKRAKRIFEELKNIWRNRDIVIVEGEQTRLGIGNDLFNNVKSIKRITVPAVGAFDKYGQIKSAVLRTVKDELVLLAVGPTATILAADLSCEGIWAIDIGHVDVEYEWFLRGAKEKIKIEGKFVNEASDGRKVEDILSEEYMNQIVERVK